MGETTQDGYTDDSCQLILETLAVVSENQHEIRETKGGGKKGKTKNRSERKKARTKADSTESRSVKPCPNRRQSSWKPISQEQSEQKLSLPSRRSKWSNPQHPIFKQS